MTVVAPALTTAYAIAKRALDSSGVLGAWIVGAPTGAASHRLALHLYFFFFSSTRITRVGEAYKALIEGEFKKGGYRNLTQVLSNAGMGSVLALLYIAVAGAFTKDHPMKLPREVDPTGPDGSPSQRRAHHQQRRRVQLQAAHMCLYAAMNGDTWASELGVLSPTLPRLITSLTAVPAGTNGAVSLYGLLASVGGGLAMGLATYVYDLAILGRRHAQFGVVAQAATAGLVGSLVDSLLGALFQYSGTLSLVVNGVQQIKVVNEPIAGAARITGRHILTNNQVNFISGLLMAIGGFYTADLFYPVDTVAVPPRAVPSGSKPAK